MFERFATKCSPLHARVFGGIGVHRGAALSDGRRAQLVVPGFVVVDLTQSIRIAEAREPIHGIGVANVDRIAADMRRCLRGGDPTRRLFFGSVVSNSVTQELVLVFG